MDTSSGNEQPLKQALQVCPLSISEHAALTLLSDRTTHDVFRVDDDDKQYVAKQFISESFTQLDREAVFKAQQVLAEHRLAPKPLWFDETKNIWIEEYVERENLPTSGDEQLKITGQALGALHQLTGLGQVLPRLDLPEQWGRYVSHLPNSVRETWLSKIEHVRRKYDELFDIEDRVPCHNDLAFDHVLTLSPMVIIDWEYAAMGNRYFDIASALMLNDAPQNKYPVLCDAYAHVTKLSAEKVLECTLNMQPVAQLTSSLWYEAKSALPL